MLRLELRIGGLQARERGLRSRRQGARKGSSAPAFTLPRLSCRVANTPAGFRSRFMTVGFACCLAVGLVYCCLQRWLVGSTWAHELAVGLMSSQIDLLLGKASFSARSSGSLSSFQAYKQEELKSQSQSQHGSSYSSSAFPEFETLSLRCDS